jgi:NADH:ubiquinone oxidoreductase subunit E
MKTEDIEAILEQHNGHRGGLISILQDIQARYSYLPADALRVVAKNTGRSLVDIYGVATFYRAFSLKPRGKHLISCCLGTACHVRGGPTIAEAFVHELGVAPGETTADKNFTLETVNCLGACALGPIVVVDGHYFSNVRQSNVKQIIAKAQAGLDKVEVKGDKRIFPVEVSCPQCNHVLLEPEHKIDGFPAIRVTAAFDQWHGWLRLSSLYGSYSVESEFDVPRDSVVNLFCPHCNAELSGAGKCPLCEAPLVPMSVRGGGIVQICARRGCTYHLLDVISDNV